MWIGFVRTMPKKRKRLTFKALKVQAAATAPTED